MMKLSHNGYDVFGDDARRKRNSAVSLPRLGIHLGNLDMRSVSPSDMPHYLRKYETAIMLGNFILTLLLHTTVASNLP